MTDKRCATCGLNRAECDKRVPNPPFTYCDETGALAIRGECTIHHGDACLKVFEPTPSEDVLDVEPVYGLSPVGYLTHAECDKRVAEAKRNLGSVGVNPKESYTDTDLVEVYHRGIRHGKSRLLSEAVAEAVQAERDTHIGLADTRVLLLEVKLVKAAQYARDLVREEREACMAICEQLYERERNLPPDDKMGDGSAYTAKWLYDAIRARGDHD